MSSCPTRAADNWPTSFSPVIPDCGSSSCPGIRRASRSITACLRTSLFYRNPSRRERSIEDFAACSIVGEAFDVLTSDPNRILLVDDEPGMLTMLKTALARYGYATEEALDGHEALERLSRHPFDVIVSDVNMPRYPGIEFLRGVRERDPDVPVIMITGKPTVESSCRAVEYGAFRYLVKPVMPATLKEVVERAIHAHEVARAKRQALLSHGIDEKWLDHRAELEVHFQNAIDGLWMAFQPIIS